MKVILLGATGLVGGHVLKQLLQLPEIESIQAPTRRPLPIHDPKLFELPLAAEKLESADALFCCLGTTIKKAGSKEAFRAVDYELPLEFARHFCELGGKHLLLISSIGANPKASAFYMRTKGEVERDIANLGLPKFTILRPSMMEGDREESRLGEKLGGALMKLGNPILQGPLKKYRVIKGEDVAEAMVSEAIHRPHSRALEILTYSDS